MRKSKKVLKKLNKLEKDEKFIDINKVGKKDWIVQIRLDDIDIVVRNDEDGKITIEKWFSIPNGEDDIDWDSETLVELKL